MIQLGGGVETRLFLGADVIELQRKTWRWRRPWNGIARAIGTGGDSQSRTRDDEPCLGLQAPYGAAEVGPLDALDEVDDIAAKAAAVAVVRVGVGV